MTKLSVCVITKNEEAMIERCLTSVQWADEIIVVDSGSTDRTVALAEKAGAKVTFNTWPGWGKQKNKAISLASHDWILSLDADEWLPDNAESIIRKAIHASTKKNADAYYLSRRTFFLGTWLRHGGWYPDRQIRLFRKSVTRFEEVPVHEKVTPPSDQSSDFLDLDLWHESYVSLDEYFTKARKYAAAQAAQQAGQKFLLIKLFIKPAYRFIQTYLVQRGFLDGAKGLLYALLSSWYEWRAIVESFRLRRPLKGRYLVKNSLLNFFLSTSDLIIKLLSPAQSNKTPPAEIKRILLSNMAHLGDVVISTAIFDVLKRNFPEAKIGILIGSWSKDIVENHPSIDWVHTLDHWKINRSSKNIFQKWRQYKSGWRQSLKEIQEIKYDLAVDLSFHFPNSIPLLWKAKIPRRLGYTSGGFGSLLTDSLEWKNHDQQVAYYQLDLLKLIPIKILPEKLKTNLPSASVKIKDLPAQYIVCHAGAGTPVKEWPLANWEFLIKRLIHEDHVVVLTGTGKREEEKIKKLNIQSERCINLCNQLPWREFVTVIQNAALIISSDSVAGHIASAYDIPSITIGHGIHNPHHWKPLSEKNIFLTFPTPCAPCYQGKGCPEMSCLNNVEAEEILSIARRYKTNVRYTSSHC